MSGFYLGIDIGTQSLKAIVVDAGMRLLGTGRVPYQPSYPQPLWAEQDTGLWLAALKPAVAQALDAAGLSPADIACLAVSGQLDGCIATDGDGRALAPAIIWMDRRAVAEVHDVDPALVRNRAGLVPDATHMGAKIAWSKRHLGLHGAVATWHQPVSFTVEALTGARVLDHSLASTTMLYALAGEAWDDELLAAFGVDREKLPAIAPAGSVAGTLTHRGAELTGLRPGTKVAVGTGDDFSNIIGSGIVMPGTVGVTLGTAEAIAALSVSLVIDPDLLVETHAFPTGAFHLGNPGWLSGGSVSWFLETFSVSSAAEFSALASQVPPGSSGLLFLPTLSGAMAPRWVATARGAFYGITAAHTKAHFARAILEGTSFAMRDVIDRFDALGVGTGHIRLMGGGVASGVWTQIRADLCGRAIELVNSVDTSAMGAAALAAVADGAAATVQDASPRMPLETTVVDPNSANRAVYEDSWQRYRALFDALEPMMPPRATQQANGSGSTAG